MLWDTDLPGFLIPIHVAATKASIIQVTQSVAPATDIPGFRFAE